MKSNFRKYVFCYLLLFFILFFIYFPYLAKWSLNGDELLAVDLPSNYNLKSALSNFTFNGPGHYQPLIAIFIKFYRFFLPNFALIHFVNLLLFTFVPFLLFICLELLLPSFLSFLLAAAFSLSPIFYFHIFAINAFANTVMLSISLCLVYLLLKTWKKPKDSYVYLSTLLFTVSIFIKETFLINFYLVLLITFVRFKNDIKKTLKIVIPLVVLIMVFFFIRSKSLGNNNIYYTYILSFYKLKETTLLFISWLFNYPLGWQYGVHLPIPKLYEASIVINIFVVLTTLSFLFYKKPIFFAAVGAGFVITLLPYLFLSRILVFHFDLTYLGLFLGIVLSLSLLYKSKMKLSSLMIFLLLLIQSITVSVTLPQWTKYSFVGESHEIASNFIQVITKAEIENFSRLCIINHFKGSWPTQDGMLAKYISQKPLQIFSTSSLTVPKECLHDNSLVLKNEDKKYYLLLEQ